MNRPTLDELMARIDSKYSLVVVAAKRARVFTETDSGSSKKEIKPVTRALREIAEGLIRFESTKIGIK
jgi:DNA-directed RNA polymerase subunit omega